MTWWMRPRSPPGAPASALQTRSKRSGGALEHLAMVAGAGRDIVTKLTEAV